MFMDDNKPFEKHCNGCGGKIHFEAKYCKICGFKQISINEKNEHDLHEGRFFEDNSIENIPEENSKSKIVLISSIFGLILIACILGFIFNRNSASQKNALSVRTTDSVIVDTISVNANTYSENVLPQEHFNDSDSSSNNFSDNQEEGSFDNLGNKLLTDFFQVNVSGDCDRLEEIFANRIDYHKLIDVPIEVVKSDILNFNRKWTIESETLISINLVQKNDNYSYFKFEKERQLKRKGKNGDLIKYFISGEMIIENSIGKIVSIKDIKANKI